MKIVPLAYFYKKEIDSYNKAVHDILMKEIPLILPNFQNNKKEKRGIIALLVTGFIRSAYEGVCGYLHNKIQRNFKESLHICRRKANLDRIFFHFEDSMVMYGICNS